MAQVAMMGPPLSPRETRRSGRRSAPSGSTSTSKSPDSPNSESAPRLLAPPNRSSSSTSSRKRTKQEDLDDPPDDSHKNTPNGTTNGVTPLLNGNGRTKRKGKEKEKPVLGLAIDSIIAEGEQTDIVLDLNGEPDVEEEEQGVTRCVCGNAGDDEESAGEFFVQCETCNVWQHGQCMGIRSEDAVKEDHYYCEQCRPDLHTELLKRLAKRPRDRHSSSNSHPVPAPASRNSRSHSPSHQKPQKRRNTMNSRDAAYDEMMALIVEHSAVEAGAATSTQSPPSPINGSVNGQADGDEQLPSPATAKKKRKRASEDAASIKRTRSASTTSDRPTLPKPPHEETPPTPKSISMPAPPVPPPKSSSSRNRRGGGGRSRPSAQAQDTASVDGDEVGVAVPGPSNRRSGGGRSRASGSRRNQNTGDQAPRRANGAATSASAPPASFTRTYSSTQQPQQPLLTSWGLPDYLAHLEPTLPSKIPQPLQLRGSGEERGVRVRWPGKRMSVGDMNKRVRALVEWVGREQASASERYRRRESLQVALGDPASVGILSIGDNAEMIVDGAPPPQPPPPPPPPMPMEEKVADGGEKSTMKMMEELMEELIVFQERYGPGAKSKDRRTAVS
ncbi:hypothetical protein EDB92DRAFT_1079801 [Lactarius akahatsu]|uniref:PHD-type domain-containing protein n=1 Tax=Lactarius akahatsu TaxID=416441 RepID=A0AAD4LFZ1_9AGAM|nr:hypothetical protein EDB92DRAFT_1079801 [Lactarius akahatsu]